MTGLFPVLFTLLVVAGFLFRFLATFPVRHADRIAWGCWLVAALIWALSRHGSAMPPAGI